MRRASIFKSCRWLAVFVFIALSACGGGSGGLDFSPGDDDAPSATMARIEGIAANGRPVAGRTVSAVNARGERASSVTAPDGRYALSISEGGPYLLSVTDEDGNAWYSYAPASGRANLTPLTTLALLNANALRPLNARDADWASSSLSAQVVLDAARLLNANLTPYFRSHGQDPAVVNVFTVNFAADSTGFDALLDDVAVSIRCNGNTCTQQITAPNGSGLTWNAQLSTTGIALTWGGGGGVVSIGIGSCRAPQANTWSLVIQPTVSGAGALPEICIDGITDKPSSRSDFCGYGRVVAALPTGVAVLDCAFDGTTGSISARLFALLTRITYRITYTFVRH